MPPTTPPRPPPSSAPGMTSPAAKQELAAVIDGILGDMPAIPVKQLPDRLLKYMQEHGHDVITPGECEEVRAYITEVDLDMDLNREDVVEFLVSMRDRPKPAAGNGSRPPVETYGSGTSSEEEPHPPSAEGPGAESTRPRGKSRASGTGKKTAFPGDPFIIPATLTSSTDSKVPVRRKKVSDASSEKGVGLGRSDLGMGVFARPSVDHSRRRSSGRKISMRSDEGDSSRHSSSAWSSGSNSHSPLSAALDYSSFHEVLRSPTERELDELDKSVLMELPQAIIMEKDKEISDLRRQHAQESVQAQATIAVMEDEVAEMQRKLDEAFENFGTEKKDLKTQHDRQIQDERAKMELELEELRRQLEAARTELSRGSQTWGVQQAKLKELTAAVLDKERYVKELQDKLEHEIELKRDAMAAADQSDKYAKELIKQLEVSRDAEHQLKLQKLENQHLQLTIENANRDYEQLQIQMEPGTANGGHSGPATLTRNAGVAISKELMDANGKGEDEGVRERVIETVVTRTIKVSSAAANGETKTETTKLEAVYTDAGTETDPVHVLPIEPSAPSEPEPKEHDESSKPPAYSAAGPDTVTALLSAGHPRHTPCSSTLDEEEYDTLVDALGVRCRVLEAEIANRRELLDKAGQKRKLRRPRAATLPGWRVDGYSWFAYSSAIFLVGVMIGGHLLAVHSAHGGLSARDYAYFTSMNSLRPVGGEGFPVPGRPLFGVVKRGALAAASGFVPT